jgi:hypothetical protein
LQKFSCPTLFQNKHINLPYISSNWHHANVAIILYISNFHYEIMSWMCMWRTIFKKFKSMRNNVQLSNQSIPYVSCFETFEFLCFCSMTLAFLIYGPVIIIVTILLKFQDVEYVALFMTILAWFWYFLPTLCWYNWPWMMILKWQKLV